LDISNIPNGKKIFQKVNLDLKSGSIELNLIARNFGKLLINKKV
jgi:hypothetical protein